MSAYVFVGPTLGAGERPKTPGLVFLPPVARGDVYRAAQRGPRAIGIIDGYFDGVASVWHKEILWAMAQGIHVFGSASMGALRAAELDDFGMRGVGRIFAAYRDGCLPPYQDDAFEDDDEVAEIHGPREAGYLALSEPLVNMRCTLSEAETAGVIQAATRDALVRLGKSLFYPERTYDRILARAAEQRLPQDELKALRAWLPRGRVDQKREDALGMLAEMRELLESDAGPMRVDYVLEWTEMWDAVMQGSAGARPGDGEGQAERIFEADILDELRLDPDAYQATRDRALLRFLVSREAAGQRPSGHATARSEILRELRTHHGLLRRSDLDCWLEANGIDVGKLERLLESESQVRRLASLPERAFDDCLLDELRWRGEYARLASRVRDKQQLLVSRDLDQPRPKGVGPAPVQLATWYFEGRLGRALPDDLEATAHELGFDGRADFYRVLLREWLYCHQSGSWSGTRREQ